VQLALLTLLKGPAAESCIEGLRRLGAMGPQESDFLALQRDGFAVRGAATGHLILTPRGRRVAGNVAVDVAHRTRAHRAVYGIDQKARTVYFRCSCGVDVTDPLDSPAAQSRMRKRWQAHRDMVGDAVRTAPMAQGSADDAKAMLADHIQGFIRATQGVNAP
jgi:hypothetical protein